MAARADHFLNHRMSDRATFQKMLQTREEFSADPVSSQLMLFLSDNLSQKMPCTKMVVLGAWAMTLANSLPHPRYGEFLKRDVPLRMQLQHIALLEIHKHLEVF